MKFGIPELNVSHPAVLAGRLMLDAYHKSSGMSEPCRIVHEHFPELSAEQIMCLWIGVNMAECPIETLEKVKLVTGE
jgi:hypothetical protein